MNKCTQLPKEWKPRLRYINDRTIQDTLLFTASTFLYEIHNMDDKAGTSIK